MGICGTLSLSKLNLFCDDLNTIDFFTIFIGVIVILYTSGQEHTGTLFEISFNEFRLFAECSTVEEIGVSITLTGKTTVDCDTKTSNR